MNKKFFDLWNKLPPNKKVEYEKRFEQPDNELWQSIEWGILFIILWIIMVVITGISLLMLGSNKWEIGRIISIGMKWAMVMAFIGLLANFKGLWLTYKGYTFLKSGGKK